MSDSNLKRGHLPGHARQKGVAFPLVRITGDPHTRGVQYGQQALERIQCTLVIYKRAYEKVGIHWDRARELARQIRPRVESYSLALFQEMCGIAEGAGLPIEDIIALNARTELLYWEDAGASVGRDDGCTGVIVMPEASWNGHLLHGQNWDWRDEAADCTIVLDVKPDNGPRLMTMVEAGMLARAGFNSAGIAVTGNSLESQEVRGRVGVPIPLIRRAILMSNSYTTALKQVFDAERSFSNNLMISSAHGEAINLETTPDEIFWIGPSDGLLVHANHFSSLAAQLKVRDLGLKRGPDSLHRERRLRALLVQKNGGVTVDDLKKAFSDTFDYHYAICASPGTADGSGRVSSTVATVLMDTTKQEMYLAPTPYQGADFRTYSFNED